MRIIIFKDNNFDAVNEYNANDIEKLLIEQDIKYTLANHSDIEMLNIKLCDLVILPYIDGEFSDKALKSLIDFHADGGSLFFLGDLPHCQRWYPLRNMHSSRFHLTRCYDDIIISSKNSEAKGLTKKGKEILGKLKDFNFFENKNIPALRVTAFPPDKCYPLLSIKSNSHANKSSAIMVTERKCSKFLGAKVALIGFIGGEPRENVANLYKREWTYNPGLLTREWKGINSVVLKLINWLEPEKIVGAIDADSVVDSGEENKILLHIKNLTENYLKIDSIELEKDDELIFKQTLELKAKEKISINMAKEKKYFGIFNYKLYATCKGNKKLLDIFTERVLPELSNIDIKSKGYGFSTYWAFQKPKVSDEFKFFCREMKRRGCTYIRANIPWEDIEPEPGVYNWTIPDQMLEFVMSENMILQFWMFPTTRASGLSDIGVPEWTLKEPAIDRYGNKGLFPSIWSPFYRKHYFNMLTEFTKRYAKAESLSRFIFDFANSDFSYGYYYYGSETSLFDYSEYERKAFIKYLKNVLELDLDKINQLFQSKFSTFAEITVPYIEQVDSYRVYLDFRTWSIKEGMNIVHKIIIDNAPEKLPLDIPGHGLGSIADISTAFYDSKKQHYFEEKKFDKKYTQLHSAGFEWGGEAWQVGGTYREYDDALFNSLRYNASYNSIPGPDLGVFGEDIAKIGFIRKAIMGAKRNQAELAVFDRTAWHEQNSLAHLAVRMDFPVDLICSKHRYDFSYYKLMTMPDCDFNNRISGCGEMLVPSDEYWYYLMKESIEKGLNLVIYPKSCEIRKNAIQRTFLREILDLRTVSYGPLLEREVEFPKSFGGGSLKGKAVEVIADGKVLLQDTNGKSILIQKQYGKGSILLAGWDSSKGRLDYELDDKKTKYIKNHTLIKLCTYFGIKSKEIESKNLYVLKEMLHKNKKDYLLIFSHNQEIIVEDFKVKLTSKAKEGIDLASGELFKLKKINLDWYQLNIKLYPRQGRYILFQ